MYSRPQCTGLVRHPRDFALQKQEAGRPQDQYLEAISTWPVHEFGKEAKHPFFPTFRHIWQQARGSASPPWQPSGAPVVHAVVHPDEVGGDLVGKAGHAGRVLVYHGPCTKEALNDPDARWPA